MKEKIKVLKGKYKDCYGEIVREKENIYNVVVQKDWFLWQIDLKENEFMRL